MSDVLACVLDSRDTGVGGGSASALAGAMAAGLVGMVARLSVGRGLPLGDGRYEALAAEVDAAAAALLAGAYEDAAAYAQLKAAYRLPRDGDGAAAVRQAAIHDALAAAAQVPLANARRALYVLVVSGELQGRSNPAAASDLEGAWLLADAAVRGCLLNVDVNLEALSPSAVAQRLRDDAEAVRAACAGAAAPPKEKS